MCGCTANHNERTYHFCSREHELRDLEKLEARIRADEREAILAIIEACDNYDEIIAAIRARKT